MGTDSISPNRHPEIESAADLLDMIHRIREVSGLPTGFKAVIGAWGWLDEVFAEVRERGIESAPDFITVDSGDGGTGAAPMSLIDNVGLPIKESLPLLVDKLDEYGDAYVQSFDRRLPPSIFVSERDRVRHGQPMPLVERCIEDHPTKASRVGEEAATD